MFPMGPVRAGWNDIPSLPLEANAIITHIPPLHKGWTARLSESALKGTPCHGCQAGVDNEIVPAYPHRRAGIPYLPF